MINLIRNTINSFRAVFGNAAANAFIQATGITGSVQKAAITQLCIDLQASGLWSKMKAVYPMVTDNRNLLSYTEDFSNAAWAKNNSTITTNTTTDPFGGSNADTLFDNGSNAAHYVSTLATGFGQNGNNTSSIYAKANTLGYLWMYFYNGSEPAGVSAWFNLSNGTVGTVQSGLTATIQDAGNGWYRCSISRNFNFTAANSNCGYGITSGDNVTSYVGTGKSIYIYGAQLELGASLSTYQQIATTPSAFMASQMKYNLKDARDLDAAFRLTWSGGWTYSATGATPNGTNAYADTKFNLSTNFGTREQSYSLYTQASNANANVLAGVTDGSSPTQFYNGTGQFNILSTLYAKGSSFSNGYILMTSTLNAISAFEKVVKLGSTSGTTYSSINYNYYIGARNNAGTADFFADRKYSFAHIGNSLTDQEALVLSQIVEKYQVALSRGVQAAQSFYYNSAYSNEANTYLYSTQITGTTQVSAINTLINGLKANNLWSKMKAVYPFVTDYTNLLSYTEDFSNAAWGKVSLNVSANTTTAPNGTLTADTIADIAANQAHSTYQSGNTINTGAMVGSVYLKDNGRRYAVVSLATGTSGQIRYSAVVDLQNGIITQNNSLNSPTNTSSSITNIGNGWYRISVKLDCTIVQSNSNYIIIAASNTGTPSTFSSGTLDPQYVGDGSSIFIWGAQLESASTATTYQPVLGTQQSSIAAQMKFNLVNPQDSDAAYRIIWAGGWTYSSNGAQPNGTNAFADTKFTPSAALTINSVHFSKYNRTNDLVGNKVDGALSTDNLKIVQHNYSAGNAIIGETASLMSYSQTDTRGLFTATRTSASLGKVFKNSAQVSSSTSTITALADRNIYFGGRNDGPVSFYNSYQSAFASIGDGLTDAEAAILYQLVQQFQTDLSRQV